MRLNGSGISLAQGGPIPTPAWDVVGLGLGRDTPIVLEMVYLRHNGQVRTERPRFSCARPWLQHSVSAHFWLVRAASHGQSGAYARTVAPIRPEIDYLSHNGRTLA